MPGSLSKHFENRRWVLALAVFLLYFTLGIFVPFMQDDWMWGSSLGLDLLKDGFAGYNGRYVSNVLVILLTRSRLLRALAYGLSFSGIVVLARRFWGEGRTGVPTLLFLTLLLAIPRVMVSQVIGWTSGFANYVISVPVLLILVWVVWGRIFTESPGQVSPGQIVLYSLLCLAGQLIIEHITLYVVVLMLFAVIYFACTKRRADPLLLALLGSAILGAVIMFSNAAYRVAIDGSGGYQDLPLRGVGLMLRVAYAHYVNILHKTLLMNNLILSLVLCVCGFSVLCVARPRLGRLASGYFVAFALYQLTRKWLPFDLSRMDMGRFLESGLVALLFLCLLYTTFAVPALRKKGGFFLLSAGVMFAPLLVVLPVGERNFFVVYVFLSIFCALMCQYCIASVGARLPHGLLQAMQRACAWLCALMSVYYLAIFGCVFVADQQRTAFVKQQAGAGESMLYVHRLPFESYLHESSPGDESLHEPYKLYYDLPEDAKIMLAPSVFPKKPS